MFGRRLLVGLVLVVAACGVEASPPLPVVPIEGADRTIDVTLREFEFSPSSFSFQRGETVGFRVTNAGAVTHEFRLTTDENVAQIVAAREQDDEAAASLDASELLDEVAPAETREILVTFDDQAQYNTLVCLIPGHREAGMQASLAITE